MFICLVVSFLNSKGQNIADGFVYLSDIDATIKTELRYLKSNNFIGKPIEGYQNDCTITTKKTDID